MRHAFADAHIHADGHCDGDCHIHSDSDSDGNSHADSDANSYAYTDSDAYCDSHGYSNGNPPNTAYTDATASWDTAAPTVRPAGCSLVWELASEPREFPLWPQSIWSTRATVHRKVPRFHG